MTEEKILKIKIPSIVTVGQLADLLAVPVSRVIAELMKNGVMATINENIDYQTAEIISDFLGFQTEEEGDTSLPAETCKIGESGDLVPRPPVVAVLGHVDHGKTSLLDKIREANVVSGESGGITQHIGAYQVDINGKKITFLDTPGHEAFEAMRAHGATITDIAIIIVAADDGIKPQTTEAIKHAKNAGTPMIVVINKIDKPGADSMRIKKQFTEIGMTPHEWGGEVEFSEVSAKSGDGIDKLLETLLAMGDMMNLKADPKNCAQGLVIESRMEVGKGPVATILMQNGTLRPGEWVQVGETYGRIKSMEDERGRRLKEAGPAMPVRISGLKNVPSVAELLQVFDSEKEAQNQAAKTKKFAGAKKLSSVKKIGLEAISEQVANLNKDELGIVVKADVVGSLDAIKENLSKLSNKYVSVKFVGEGVGSVSDSDIQMASVSDKIIICFKVGKEPGVDGAAKTKGVKILRYDVIYELIDDIKKILEDMLPSEKIEIPVGKLKVIAVFKVSGKKTVVGGKVEEGKAEKDVWARVKRGGDEVARYFVSGIQREKEEVKSVGEGSECGISFSTKADAKEGDVIEFFREEERKVTA